MKPYAFICLIFPPCLVALLVPAVLSSWWYVLFHLGVKPILPLIEKELVIPFNNAENRNEFKKEIRKRITRWQMFNRSIERTHAQSTGRHLNLDLELLNVDLELMNMDLGLNLSALSFGEGVVDVVPEHPEIAIVEQREFVFQLVFNCLVLLPRFFQQLLFC